MDLYKLRSFHTVAELGSFSRAAEVLFLTQPAVSAQIKDLEYKYKAKLFDRVGRNIKLTAAGETLFGYVNKILDIFEESQAAVNSLKNEGSGYIKLGVSGLPGASLLPGIISNFKNRFPATTFYIKTQRSAAVVESIKQNNFDLGLIVGSDCKLNRPELVEKVLYKDRIVLGVSKKHPLGSRRSVKVEELTNLPLIVSLKNTVSRQALDKLFHEYSFQFNIAYEIDSKSMIKAMVEKNLGIGFFSTLEIRKEVESGLIHSLEIENTPIYRYIHVIYHKNHELSPSAKAFYSFIFNPLEQAEYLRDNESECGK